MDLEIPCGCRLYLLYFWVLKWTNIVSLYYLRAISSDVSNYKTRNA